MKENEIEVIKYFNQETVKKNRSTSSHNGLGESSHARRRSGWPIVRARSKNGYREVKLDGEVLKSPY